MFLLLPTQAPNGSLFPRRCTLSSHPPSPYPNPLLFSTSSSSEKRTKFLYRNPRKPFNLTVANAETRGDSGSATKHPLPPPSFNYDETVFVGEESVPLEGVIQFDKPNSSLQLKWGRIALLSGGNVLAVLLFSAIGSFSHGFPVLDNETFRTADPFIAAAAEQVEFDYMKGNGKGPENWGDLHEEWAACKNGTLQSPIDLLQERVEVVPELGNVKKSYKPANATLKKRGHNIFEDVRGIGINQMVARWKDTFIILPDQFFVGGSFRCGVFSVYIPDLHWVMGSAGSIQINGTDYALDQCHWHSPSEHTINGKRFGLELHMVHRNLELNKTAVIGVLYNISVPDSFLSELEKDILNITDTDEEVNVGVVDPTRIHIGGSKYYGYLGSLTTPPCTEGVIWIINEELLTVSQEQVMLLRRSAHDNSKNNARPLQPLNDRGILFYSLERRTLPTISLVDIT
ncbi:Alpha carbonic anhydrase [Macleaya cordata]|uniref:Carbonic anhydrase n=1 Tax=Macleaya cordata TaxID=56857 RepID=A0A200R5I8_MACCD|nr:Alpha carbonic anhydrase [Macleaya cordata]